MSQTTTSQKERFISAFLEALQEKHDWAKDPVKLEKWRTVAISTLNGGKDMSIDGPAVLSAWKFCGFKGKPTYKGLHNL